MKKDIKQTIKNIAPLYNEPSNNSQLETELLFGEYFEVKNYNKKWAFGINCSDNYKGWVEIKNLGEPLDNNYKITSLQSLVYETPNIKSKVKFNLFMGSLINVENIKKNWVQIRLNKNDEFGFVDINSISSLDYSHKNWVGVAEKFINTPYKWGGKTALGIDCSGLLQISLLSCGKHIPRNTEEQFKMKLEDIPYQQGLSRGDLVFWKGHVAIVQNKNKLVHANQFHLKVFSEDINDTIYRIKEKMDLKPTFKKINL